MTNNANGPISIDIFAVLRHSIAADSDWYLETTDAIMRIVAPVLERRDERIVELAVEVYRDREALKRICELRPEDPWSSASDHDEAYNIALERLAGLVAFFNVDEDRKTNDEH